MTSTIAPVEERRNFGIGLLLFSQLFFATLDTSAKYLGFIGLPLTQIVFIRYAIHVALAIALFLPFQRNLFVSRNWKLQLMRGLCLLGVTAANFGAMQFLPLTVTAPDKPGPYQELFTVTIADRAEPITFKAAGRIADN